MTFTTAVHTPDAALQTRTPAASGLPTAAEEANALQNFVAREQAVGEAPAHHESAPAQQDTTKPGNTAAGNRFGTGYVGEQAAMMYAREHMTGAELYSFMMQLTDPKARGAFYATVAGGGAGQNDLQAYVLEHMFGGDTNARNNWVNANCAGGGGFSCLGGIATYFVPGRGQVQQKLNGWPS